MFIKKKLKSIDNKNISKLIGVIHAIKKNFNYINLLKAILKEYYNK